MGIFHSNDGLNWEIIPSSVGFGGNQNGFKQDNLGNLYFFTKSRELYKFSANQNSFLLINSELLACTVQPNGDIIGLDFLNRITKSFDNGGSFIVGINSIPPLGIVKTLSFFGNGLNFISFSSSGGNRVYQFSDDGSQVELIPLPSFPAIEQIVLEPNNTLFFVARNAFLRSLDGAETWQPVDLPAQTDIWGSFLGRDKDGMLWIQRGGVYQSSDGGATWIENTNIDFKVEDRAMKIVFSNNTNYSIALNYLCSYASVSFSNNKWLFGQNISDKIVYPTQPESSFRLDGRLYTKNCLDWSVYENNNWREFRLNIGNSSEPMQNSIVKLLSGAYYTFGLNRQVLHSSDQGQEWEGLVSNAPAVPILADALATDKNGVFLYVLYNNTLSRKSSIGSIFNELSTVEGNKMLVDVNGNIYVYNNQKISISRNKGLTFQEVPLGVGAGTSIYSVHSTSKGVTIISFTSTLGGNPNCYISLNEGYDFVPFNSSIFPGNLVSNSEGDIFTFGNKKILRSVDNCQSWEDFELDGLDLDYATLAIDSYDYLYIQARNNPIYKSLEPTVEGSMLTGFTFLDDSKNCIWDSGEIGLGQQKIRIHEDGKAPYYRKSSPSGQFSTRLSAANYELTTIAPNALFDACPSQNIAASGLTSQVDTFQLGMQVVQSCPYMSVDIGVTFLLRRCFDSNYLTVRYCNEGSAKAENVRVEVHLDSFLIPVATAIPYTNLGNGWLSFEVGDVFARQCGEFRIQVEVSCLAELGDVHCMEARIYPNTLCDSALDLLSSKMFCEANSGSYDPNDKTAFIDGQIAPYEISMNKDLEYMIRFQNTGTDTAFTVRILDKISPLLDIATFKVGVASHPMQYDFIEDNTIQFTFSDIMLPDSNINEVASHGFVKFTIKQQPDLPYFSLIENLADIYFDFNDPVRTNTVELQITPPSSITNRIKTEVLTAFPNPADANFSITNRNEFAHLKQASFYIHNAFGTVLYQTDLDLLGKINTFDFPTGFYMLSIRDADGLLRGKGKIIITH